MKITKVPLDKIVSFKGRTHNVNETKVLLNMERLTQEGFRGYLTGRRLKDGTVEQFNGHNRLEAAKRLKLATLPFQLGVFTDEQAWNIYTRDNSLQDQQSTGWALGVARNGFTFWQSKGLTDSEIYAHIGGQMGLSGDDLRLVRQLGEAVQAGLVSQKVEDILYVNVAVSFWKKLKEWGPEKVSMVAQEKLVQQLIDNPTDAVRQISRVFSDWKKLSIAEGTMVMPKARKGPITKSQLLLSVSTTANKLRTLLAELDDFELTSHEQAEIAKGTNFSTPVVSDEDRNIEAAFNLMDKETT